MLRSGDKRDNRGLSLVELIVVIAIVMVLTGAAGFGLSLLVGTEARQAVYKMEAQLNDVKTGTLTKAGEDLLLRYIEVPDKKSNPSGYEAWALKGVEQSGYYADKCLYTIVINSPDGSPGSVTSMMQHYSDKHEYSYIGAQKVEIEVFYSGGSIKLDPGNAVMIRYNRRTGALYDIEVGTSDDDGNFTSTDSGAIDRMTIKSGLRTYIIHFTPQTGSYSIESL